MNTEAISQSQKFPISGYLKLTKPSIIYLLVLTAATAMFLADGFAGNLSNVIFGLFGIALIASSSAVINQILDVEIDSKMVRTKNRPLVKGEITATNAKVFSGILLASGTILLLVFNNVLTLLLTLLTWAFYSFFYTKILKFAGTQNKLFVQFNSGEQTYYDIHTQLLELIPDLGNVCTPPELKLCVPDASSPLKLNGTMFAIFFSYLFSIT